MTSLKKRGNNVQKCIPLTTKGAAPLVETKKIPIDWISGDWLSIITVNWFINLSGGPYAGTTCILNLKFEVQSDVNLI